MKLLIVVAVFLSSLSYGNTERVDYYAGMATLTTHGKGNFTFNVAFAVHYLPAQNKIISEAYPSLYVREEDKGVTKCIYTLKSKETFDEVLQRNNVSRARGIMRVQGAPWNWDKWYVARRFTCPSASSLDCGAIEKSTVFDNNGDKVLSVTRSDSKGREMYEINGTFKKVSKSTYDQMISVPQKVYTGAQVK